MKLTDWIIATASCAMVFIGWVQLDHNLAVDNYLLASEKYQMELTRMEKELNRAKALNLHSLNQWEKESQLMLQVFETRKEQCQLIMAGGKPKKECLDSAYRLFDIWEQSERDRIKHGDVCSPLGGKVCDAYMPEKQRE